MRELVAWVAAGCFLVLWAAAEYERAAAKREVTTSYTLGLIEGSRQQALRPCGWKDLFRQGELK